MPAGVCGGAEAHVGGWFLAGPRPDNDLGKSAQDRRPPQMRKKFPHQDSRKGCSKPQERPGRPQGPPPPRQIIRPCLRPGGRSRPQERPGRPQKPPPPGQIFRSAHAQKGAACSRSGQGGRRGHRCPGRFSGLSMPRRAQQAPGVAREAAGATAAPADHPACPCLGGRSKPQERPERPQ